MRFAPFLQDVAGRLASLQPAVALREDPVRWAYALRDAVALAPPALVLSHLDAELEAQALLAGLAADGDWIDRVADAAPLATSGPGAAAVELVATLAGAFRGGLGVAAVLSAPADVAAAAAGALGVRDDPGDRSELADLAADALAGLVSAYAAAGAGTMIVVEHAAGGLDAADRDRSHAPLARALAHHRVDAVICPLAGREPPPGYPLSAPAWDGAGTAPQGAARVDAALWSLDPDAFAARWAAIEAAAGAMLLLSDGAIAADAPPENLRASI